ncbi:hypothetical protein H6P81_019439 [Aristolochia fimbriata]|uniref:Uncharacterized protein n=1 Tax=Aristolochia fimbriata TaxID=158543 RepID=A0AAV7DSL1_ARIFI|nr:hypothetical protein H6P81_019439 [Aristolochia fimbriata]
MACKELPQDGSLVCCSLGGPLGVAVATFAEFNFNPLSGSGDPSSANTFDRMQSSYRPLFRVRTQSIRVSVQQPELLVTRYGDTATTLFELNNDASKKTRLNIPDCCGVELASTFLCCCSLKECRESEDEAKVATDLSMVKALSRRLPNEMITN